MPRSVRSKLPLLLSVFVALFTPHTSARAESYDLIICGSGGDDIHAERFADWGVRLRSVLIEQMGHPIENVTLLSEPTGDEGGVAAPIPTASLENIQSTFTALAEQLTGDDDLFVYLMGHGSYLRKISKFHIAGPDLTADALDGMIDQVAARRVVVINSFSSSAGFINALSGRSRVIATATKSAAQSNSSHFMEFFIQSLVEGSADQNRDERISVLEVCLQASLLTEFWYEGEGLIATEHSLIDDNGDSLGSRLDNLFEAREIYESSEASGRGTASALDGAISDVCFLKDFSFAEWVPPGLIARYLFTLEAIEELKAEKSTIDPVAYYARLEIMIVRAARLNHAIRFLTERLERET